MKLIENARQVHAKAWSVRFNYAVAILGGIQAGLVELNSQINAIDPAALALQENQINAIHHLQFYLALATAGFAACAIAARLIRQDIFHR